VIAELRASSGLPNLRGVDVWIAGLAPGDGRMATTSKQLRGLCVFWRAIVEASHGRLKFCGAALPGITQQ
jgi:hypothetical protein